MVTEVHVYVVCMCVETYESLSILRACVKDQLCLSSYTTLAYAYWTYTRFDKAACEVINM